MATELGVRDAFVDLAGLRFHYRDWGGAAAQPLVLLHGVTGHARVWDRLAAAMADRFRVLALDQRGHGETSWADAYGTELMAADIGAFAGALSLAPFTLLGHSMGGVNAYTFAGDHPDALSRLVIVDFGPDTVGGRASQIVRAGIQAAAESVFGDPEDAVRAARAANPRPAEADLRHRVLNNLRQREDGRWVWRYDAAGLAARPSGRMPSAEMQWQSLARITCPTLVVRGAESDALSRESAERMAKALPNGRMVEVEKAGHSIPLDNPDGFLAAVRPFLLGES